MDALYLYFLLILFVTFVALFARGIYTFIKTRKKTVLLKILILVIIAYVSHYFLFIHKFQYKQDLNLNKILEADIQEIKPEELIGILDSNPYNTTKKIGAYEGIHQNTHKKTTGGFHQWFTLKYRRDASEEIQITITHFDSEHYALKYYNSERNIRIEDFDIQEEKEQEDNQYFVTYLLHRRTAPDAFYQLKGEYTSYAVFKKENLIIEIKVDTDSKQNDCIQDAIDRLVKGYNELKS